MPFDKASLILIDYTAKVKDTEKVFESTMEEDAKKHSIYDPNTKYQPKLVSVGESWVLKGLDEALAKANVGDKLTVEVSPDKGFGERDSGKVRIVPLRKLGEDAEKVSVGDSIEIDNKKGIIRHIGSGRVQIDFNHRYAGKTILYDVNVAKALESSDDKILGILNKHLPKNDSKLQFQNSADNLDVSIPDKLFRADGLQTIKRLIQLDLFKFIPTLQKVNFIETFENQAAKYPRPQTEEKNPNNYS